MENDGRFKVQKTEIKVITKKVWGKRKGTQKKKSIDTPYEKVEEHGSSKDIHSGRWFEKAIWTSSQQTIKQIGVIQEVVSPEALKLNYLGIKKQGDQIQFFCQKKALEKRKLIFLKELVSTEVSKLNHLVINKKQGDPI